MNSLNGNKVNAFNAPNDSGRAGPEMAFLVFRMQKRR
jgi:hypothetical protein